MGSGGSVRGSALSIGSHHSLTAKVILTNFNDTLEEIGNSGKGNESPTEHRYRHSILHKRLWRAWCLTRVSIHLETSLCWSGNTTRYIAPRSTILQALGPDLGMNGIRVCRQKSGSRYPRLLHADPEARPNQDRQRAPSSCRREETPGLVQRHGWQVATSLSPYHRFR